MQALKDPFKGQEKTMAEPRGSASPPRPRSTTTGRFTAIIGFEWTSGPDGNNLHRNVIFRDGKDKADQIIPLSYYDTGDPGGSVEVDGRPTSRGPAASCSRSHTTATCRTG